MADNTSTSGITMPQPEPSPLGGERRSMSSRILRASFAVMLAHIILKLLSPIQYALIGHFCNDVTRDLFVFGFEVLGMLFLVGEESLGPAFLPVFLERKHEDGEEAAWRFANTILTAQCVLIGAAVALVVAMPVRLVESLTTWGAEGRNPVYMALAPEYARYMVLALFGMSLGSTTYMLLNAYKRFFLAAFGDAVLKLGLVGALATGWALHMDINGGEALWVFTFGLVIGSVLKLGAHLVGLRGKLRFFRFRLDLHNPGLRKFLILVAPLLLGIVFAKIRDTYNNIVVLSYLSEGLLSASAFGRKIYQTLGFLVPYAVSIAMLPFLCEMVDRHQREELGATVTRSARLILLVFAPAAALVAALSLPITRVAFQGGQYTFGDCVNASVANACYSVVLPFAALETIFMQTFFANRRMISVTVIGLLFSGLSMAISWFFVVHLGYRETIAVAAVALAFTVSRVFKTVTLGAYMRRFAPVFPFRETAAYLLRLFIVSGAVGLVAWGARAMYERHVPIPTEGGRWVIFRTVGPELLTAGLAGTLVGLGLIYLLCREELFAIRDWTLARFHRGRSR